jgi:hypothetical protein
MPTVLRVEGFRFFFYSKEGNEPAHVHVEHQENRAKFWLFPVSRLERRIQHLNPDVAICNRKRKSDIVFGEME